jgi:hypothetical protein
MKPISIDVAVPNCLLFVRDSMVAEIPDVDYGEAKPIWSTATCIVVNCMVDSEGKTNITVGAAGQVFQTRRPIFDGLLETPSRKLILDLVSDEKVLEVGVPSAKSRIRVWTDGRHECAEQVVIGIG